MFNDKNIDDKGRFVILICEIQGTKFQFINTYAPNTENEQIVFFNDICDVLATMDYNENVIWGGDFNCWFDILDAVEGNKNQKGIL